MISEEEKLNILEAATDTSIQIGDGDVLPLEQSGAAGAGTTALELSLITPAAYGGGVDAKDTGDLGNGQQGLLRFPVRLRQPGRKAVHQISPVTFSGSREFPNQWLKTEPAGASAIILDLTSP